jgi:hypothetical protein
MRKKIWIGLAILAVFGGIFLLVNSLNYLFSYFNSPPENSYRNEYLQGVVISVLIACPFWWAASGFMYPIKNVVPSNLYFLINIVSFSFLILFIAFHVYIFILALLEKNK